jgi:hypothetical protein
VDNIYSASHLQRIISFIRTEEVGMEIHVGMHSGIGGIVSSPKERKDADGGEHGAQRQKRSKEKLIRLDDLLPDKKVVGGRHLFGVTDITHNKKHN